MKLSVIVPVLNEAAAIRGFVSDLRARLPTAEVIVVDGGSEDETRSILESMRARFDLRLLGARRGRATQMNCGARAATGDILLFLHADSRLPCQSEDIIGRALADDRVSGGCFRLRFPRREWIYRVSDSLGNLAVDLFQIALGDHGIFCRRESFFDVGGYPLVPLMEDAEFYRRLKRCGSVRQLRLTIETSPRRYEELGRYRTTFFYLAILVLYVLKVSPHFLARWHGRVTRPSVAEASCLWGPRAFCPPDDESTGETPVAPTGKMPLLQLR